MGSLSTYLAQTYIDVDRGESLPLLPGLDTVEVPIKLVAVESKTVVLISSRVPDSQVAVWIRGLAGGHSFNPPIYSRCGANRSIGRLF